MEEDPYRNKRKFQDEILEVRVAKQKHNTCLSSETESHIQLDIIMSAKDSNSFSEDADSVMSVSHDVLLHMSPYDSTSSSSSSVNWSGEIKASDASNLYSFPSSEDCEFSSSEYDTKQSIEDLFSSNSNNSVLSSGRWDVNQDIEQVTEKLTIDKEFEQYFSMLML